MNDTDELHAFIAVDLHTKLIEYRHVNYSPIANLNEIIDPQVCCSLLSDTEIFKSFNFLPLRALGITFHGLENLKTSRSRFEDIMCECSINVFQNDKVVWFIREFKAADREMNPVW